MRVLFSTLLMLTAACALVAGSRAQDKKEVTLKGTILCAKCALKEAKKCQTAIQVKEGARTLSTSSSPACRHRGFVSSGLSGRA